MSRHISDKVKQGKTCQFRISDVADLMGLSVSGVIYLEKKGGIHAQRGDNGYRYYDEDVITQLGTLRSFERMGFSLKEAVALLDTGTEETLSALKEKRQALCQQIQWIDLLTDKIQNACQKRNNPESAGIETVLSPAFYYFPYWEKYFNLQSMTRQEQRALRKVDISWLNTIPVVNYCGKLTLCGDTAQWQKGMIVTVEDALRHNLALHPMVERYPPRRCLHAFFEHDPKQLLEEMLDYARAQDVTVVSPILLIIHHMENSNFSEKNFLSEVWLPFEEKTT